MVGQFFTSLGLNSLPGNCVMSGWHWHVSHWYPLTMFCWFSFPIGWTPSHDTKTMRLFMKENFLSEFLFPMIRESNGGRSMASVRWILRKTMANAKREIVWKNIFLSSSKCWNLEDIYGLLQILRHSFYEWLNTLIVSLNVLNNLEKCIWFNRWMNIKWNVTLCNT